MLRSRPLRGRADWARHRAGRGWRLLEPLQKRFEVQILHFQFGKEELFNWLILSLSLSFVSVTGNQLLSAVHFLSTELGLQSLL